MAAHGALGRRVRAGLAIVLALTVAGACGRSGSKPKEPLATLRFGLLQAVDQLPFFVMQQQGFAARNGLRLVPTVLPGGVAVIKAIQQGAVDFGYPGSVPVLGAMAVGTIPTEATVVAATAFADGDHKAFAVVVGKGVIGWKDLAGRDIAVNQPGTIGAISVQLRLRAEGVGGARLVSIPFPNQGLAVADGTVAGAAMIDPYLAQSLLRGDGKVLDWIVGGGEPFPTFPISVVTVSMPLLRDQPARVKSLLRAHVQALRWINSHPEQAKALLIRRLGLTPEVGRGIHLLSFPSDARDDAAALERVRAAMASLDPRSVPSEGAAVFDERLLEQVLAEPAMR